MHSFRAPLERFSSNGEKTGWTYVEIPEKVLLQLKLESRKAFRIKGSIDGIKFERLSTYPLKGGRFIIAIAGAMRKKLKKDTGAMVEVKLAIDDQAAPVSPELVACLKEDSLSEKRFLALTNAERNYFHRYVFTAKGQDTRAGRIVHVIEAMLREERFGEMVRRLKAERRR